ncbi:MAG TPA: CdaR family protein [Desulfosporosinus sp.]|nr:CdaR family protein [Desulfosporosinus sp.]
MHMIIRRNLGVKVISFLFAILFWLFVMNQGTTSTLIPEQTLTIPLVANGLPQNMVLMTQLPLVRVRLQGINPSANIKDIYAQIDLTDGAAGERNYGIHVNNPVGTKVVDTQPTNIQLKLDTVDEKTVPVEAVISGAPADGYQLGTTFVKPSAVNVRGPSSILRVLTKVTVDVTAEGVSETIETSRPVSFRDKDGKPIFDPNPSMDSLSASPTSVDVIVPVIAKGLSSKMIPLKATSTGTPAEGRILRGLMPSPFSVQVLGTPQALKGLDSLNLGPVDLTNLAEDKAFQIPIEKVTLPKGISFSTGTTLSVVAQIGPGTVQKSISGLAVEIRSIGTGLDVDQPVAPIEIVVEGLPDILKDVAPTQIQLWVDANGKVAGPYPNSKVFWQLPPGVTMITTPEVSYSLKAKVAKGAKGAE